MGSFCPGVEGPARLDLDEPAHHDLRGVQRAVKFFANGCAASCEGVPRLGSGGQQHTPQEGWFQRRCVAVHGRFQRGDPLLQLTGSSSLVAATAR